jgi:hypothetical protein
MKKFCLNIIYSLTFLLVLHEPSGAQSVKKMVPEAADQIHFSIINNTAITFDWVGTAENIKIGRNPKNLSRSVKGIHSQFLPVTSPWTSDPGPYREAKLTGLKKNTTYYYSIGGKGEVNRFRTPPPSGAGGFRICLTSDMHENSKECVAMFNQISGLKPDLVLTTGDVTGAGPDGQQEIAERFHDAMVWSQSAAWMPAWGNHDWEYTDVDDLRTLKGRFDIPHPGTISSSPAVSCCGEDWGWFDYGNTRFISYPEPWTSASWIEWSNQVAEVFTSAQNDPKIKFIITFGHRSSYTSTLRRSPGDTHLREILDGFHASFPKYKLDLSGHNHQYERYLLTTGMTYIVNSTTGSYYHEGWDSPTKPEDCAFRAIHYGILLLDFTDNFIGGRFICSENTTQTGADYMPLEEHLCNEPGAVIDSFTIRSP